MRKYTIPQNMTVEYILGDHLGSTSLTTDSTGTKTSEMRYNPWGEVRYTWTTSLSTTPAYQLTRYTYTGQYSYMDDPTTAGVTEGFGLMFYQARWYDPGLGRFAQADSIIPLQTQGVQAWDRYAGMNNNPVRYNDPSGHKVCEDDFDNCGKTPIKPKKGGNRVSIDRKKTSPDVPSPITPGRSEQSDCLPGNLVGCFYSNGVMPAGDYEISFDEFVALMDAINSDVSQRSADIEYDFRAWYDTPFYDLGALESNLCVEYVGCFARHELNYIAQGAASAASGESHGTMNTLIVGWKLLEYGRLPSIKTYQAAAIGYHYYHFNNPNRMVRSYLLPNFSPFFSAAEKYVPGMNR